MSLVANLHSTCPDYKEYDCRQSWATGAAVPDHWAVMRSNMTNNAMTQTSATIRQKRSITAPPSSGKPQIEEHVSETIQPLQHPACGRCGQGRGGGASMSTSTNQWGDGRADPIGHSTFTYVPKQDLHGAGPTDYTLTPYRPRTARKSPLHTSANQRAKAGFVYWWNPRPKPTRFGGYSIGSQKTTLGIAFAPRS